MGEVKYDQYRATEAFFLSGKEDGVYFYVHERGEDGLMELKHDVCFPISAVARAILAASEAAEAKRKPLPEMKPLVGD